MVKVQCLSVSVSMLTNKHSRSTEYSVDSNTLVHLS